VTPSEMREIDARIAKEIFGLVPCQATHSEGELCYANPTSPAHGGELASYSSDIGDALDVVEKLRPEMMTVDLCGNADGWQAAFDTGSRTFAANNESLPIAICLAALKSVSGERVG
jgi:ABA sandwich protein